MNNKKRATLYPVSKQGEENNFLRFLIDSVHAGDDPILVYADFRDVADEAMASMLDCSLQTYRLHKKLNGESASSPLSADHVLNFCQKSGIHPADLASTTENPEDSCRPYIYAAILKVYKDGKYKADQRRAEVGLTFERARYEAFIESYPDIAEIFSDIQAHRLGKIVESQGADLNIGDLGKRFTERAIDLDLPQFHAEDYHQHVLAGMKEKQAEIDALKKDERARRVDLKRSADFFFGRQNTHLINKAVEDLADLLDNETRYKMPRRVRMLSERLSARFPLNQKRIKALEKYEKYVGPVSPTACVEQFAKAALSLRVFQKGEYKEQLALLQQSLGRDQDFIKWLRVSEDAKFFYMQHIYHNNVIDIDRPRISASAVMDGPSQYDHF